VVALIVGTAGGAIASRRTPTRRVASMVIGIVGALAVGYAAYYVTGAGFTVV
jgi:uncharacterized membrane protein YeaQ/YmgE (transglycosylase-associated protein family)